GIELMVADGNDSVLKQVADMEAFITARVDVILISPKEAEGLTEVVDKAAAAGIPVIVLDRDVNTRRYTQFIGGDNRAIGRAAGAYAVGLLGGPGKARGNLVEIWGGMKSTPARDRHLGFHEVVDQEGGIVLVNKPEDADWKQHLAYDVMSRALDANRKIDLVYAHNDPMAYGAHLAAKDVGREGGIAFLGIDGIPEEGVRWVRQGVLTATFLYKTPGDEGIRQALKLLSGQAIDKTVTLPTMVIDRERAAAILQANGLTR
ncbi:MAG: substrate-binding domain-containing protein, partial [Rhodospirillales bacterium]|nr:substrate-binding domain-containing protein [Rhodospirillales bacterium]